MRVRSGLVVVVAMLLVSALLGACVPAQAQNLGVTPSPAGTPRIVFVHCEDRGITSVALLVASAALTASHVAWRIRSPRASAASVFTVGRTPVGFHEAVPLTRRLPPHRRLYARVRTTVGSYGMAFRSLELVPGMVTRPTGPVAELTFAEQACF